MPEKKTSWLLPVLLLSIPLYIMMGYFIERHDSVILTSCWVVLFALYLAVMQKIETIDIRWLIGFAILFRLLFLFAVPVLSDDIYRYIWDGRLLAGGINPYEYLPGEVIGRVPGVDGEFFQLLNSPHYYSVYPPVAQFVFWVSAVLFPGNLEGSILVFRLFVLLAEVGIFFLLFFLARQYRIHPANLFWYALNPLVILELAGSLHLEVFMIFFVLLAISLLSINRTVTASVAFALAIGVKLLPLMFLPLMIKRLGFKKAFVFFTFTGAFTLLLFAPLMGGPLVKGLSSSLGLYYQKFEFNAGPWFLVREIGYWVKGYNIIQSTGPWLAILSGILIIAYTRYDYQKKILLTEAAAILSCIYFSFSTIIHPWYIVPIVALFSLSRRKLGVVWSFFVFFTYLGYTAAGYSEQYALVAIEYLAVFSWYFYEWKKLKSF